MLGALKKIGPGCSSRSRACSAARYSCVTLRMRRKPKRLRSRRWRSARTLAAGLSAAPARRCGLYGVADADRHADGGWHLGRDWRVQRGRERGYRCVFEHA